MLKFYPCLLSLLGCLKFAVLMRIFSAVSGNLNQPDTMIGQMYYIWKNDGVRGFYRGLAPNLVKAVPAVAISYYVYEHMRTWLGAAMT